MKQFQKCFFLAALFFVFWGCQKDDICPPGTETTPNLVIEFYDATDPSRLKAVENLVVRATDREDILLGPVTTNTVTIPLKTNENFTEYSFMIEAGGEGENEDIITFTYAPTLEYINRACGYRVEFLDIGVTAHNDDNNWIFSEVILQENIENEAEAHIAITH